ncbi:hypothetical protein AMTR_s00005p00243280 [Amborella trichopoda]|uniref:Uncharacterized protein n=1 Tax=Amborella trichopoda TaxID=13333 RepID=W1PGN2_AMBTC|nr:hypothetical protein AMTR_s00005p00243280 [Amborella trichopoda]
MEDYERPEGLLKFVFAGIQHPDSINPAPSAQQMGDIIQLLYGTAFEALQLSNTDKQSEYDPEYSSTLS